MAASLYGIGCSVIAALIGLLIWLRLARLAQWKNEGTGRFPACSPSHHDAVPDAVPMVCILACQESKNRGSCRGSFKETPAR
jgi:hypothetical protein